MIPYLGTLENTFNLEIKNITKNLAILGLLYDVLPSISFSRLKKITMQLTNYQELIKGFKNQGVPRNRVGRNREAVKERLDDRRETMVQVVGTKAMSRRRTPGSMGR